MVDESVIRKRTDYLKEILGGFDSDSLPASVQALGKKTEPYVEDSDFDFTIEGREGGSESEVKLDSSAELSRGNPRNELVLDDRLDDIIGDQSDEFALDLDFGPESDEIDRVSEPQDPQMIFTEEVRVRVLAELAKTADTGSDTKERKTQVRGM